MRTSVNTVTITSPQTNNVVISRQTFSIIWGLVSGASYSVSVRNLNTNELIINGRHVMAGTNHTEVLQSQLVAGNQYRIAIAATVGGVTIWSERYFWVQGAGALHFLHMPPNGTGFTTYGQAARRWGTHATLSAIQSAAVAFNGRGFGLVPVGNISYEDGRAMPPSVSHRQGRDVDIRPIRTDGSGASVTIHDNSYSHARTRALIQDLLATGNVTNIFFNDEALTNEFAVVSDAPGHDDHLHVRYTA